MTIDRRDHDESNRVQLHAHLQTEIYFRMLKQKPNLHLMMDRVNKTRIETQKIKLKPAFVTTTQRRAKERSNEKTVTEA